MGYSLKIEKSDGSPISIQEWQAAIEKVPNVRLSIDDTVGSSPNNSQKIRIKAGEGDADVCVGHSGFLWSRKPIWQRTFRFFEGRAIFKATEEVENPQSAAHKVAASLANVLGAQISGDEGEIYDWPVT